MLRDNHFFGFFLSVTLGTLAIGFGWLLYRRNRKLVQAHEKLRQASQFKDDIFKIVGHDINSVMGGISGLLLLLKKIPDIGTEGKGYIDRMIMLHDYAIDLAEKLFVLGMDREDSPYGDSKLLIPDDLVTVLAHAENFAAEKQIRLKIENTGKFVTYASPIYVEFILRTLLNNAIKYSPAANDVVLRILRRGERAVFEVYNACDNLHVSEIETMLHAVSDIDYYPKGNRSLGVSLSLCREIAHHRRYSLSAEIVDFKNLCFSFSVPILRL